MADLRFDGRVAVVTGGGRGLGRAYALLLASQGAKVVVNDPGGSLAGDGTDARPAEEVVREITAAGGEAVASTDSVATPAGGKAIIDAALDRYGRIDILIHNAGNVRRASLKEMTYDDFDAVLDVHLRGAFHVVRPAFPLMCDAGYGRIVLTSSIGGLYGNHDVANYAVAKAGVIGLSNVAAIEGAAHGVKSNVIVPAAVTQNGRGHRHLGLPADGLRSWWRPWSAGWRTNPVRSPARCWSRSPAGWPGPSSPKLPACTGRRGRSRRSANTSPRSATRRTPVDLPGGARRPRRPHPVQLRRWPAQGARPWLAPGPLAGVRVVDLTAMVMGPYCTQIMADMGADVIKVEPPEGDNTRFISVGPAPGMSGVFVNVNRGKRSVVLDLRTEAGRTALRALIRTADVFIHSMRAKAIAKLGFGYDDVAAHQPDASSTPTATATAGAGRSGTCPPTTTPSRPSAVCPPCRNS